MRYEAHQLVLAPPDEEPVCLQGALAAALLSALLVDTDEGESRSIVIETDEQRKAWIVRYEHEVRRDDWGLLDKEVQMLSDVYIQLSIAGITLMDICPNTRLLDLALQLLDTYMHYLTVEMFGEHIWECYPWQVPFGKWLLEAAYHETVRQRYYHTNWTNPAQVTDLVEHNDAQATLFFEGEAADDIMQRYFDWLWPTYQAQTRERPGENPTKVSHRNLVVEKETDWSFLLDEVHNWPDEQQRLWGQWLLDWTTFITRRLKPQRPVMFWTRGVSEPLQDQLTDYLLVQEKQPMRYKSLTPAVYALRQLGYIRRACSVTDITRWLSEHLQYDYTERNPNQQFRRAWKALRRYSPEVEDCVSVLAGYGIRPFTPPAQA